MESVSPRERRPVSGEREPVRTRLVPHTAISGERAPRRGSGAPFPVVAELRGCHEPASILTHPAHPSQLRSAMQDPNPARSLHHLRHPHALLQPPTLDGIEQPRLTRPAVAGPAGWLMLHDVLQPP